MDLVLIAISIAINIYVFQHAEELAERLKYIDEVTNQDIFYGTCLIIVTLEITRRTSGWALVIISGAFLAYGIWGQYMPGGLSHNGISYDRLIEQLFLLTDGIYGVPLGAAAGMIFAFVMFGAFLECSNMSSVFMSLSCLLTRNAKAAPPRWLFLPRLFSAPSMVPRLQRVRHWHVHHSAHEEGRLCAALRRRRGSRGLHRRSDDAPHHGRGRLHHGDVVGVSYLTIAKAALIPSILYYFTLYVCIHLEAVRKNMGTIPAEMVPQTSEVVRRLYYMFRWCSSSPSF